MGEGIPFVRIARNKACYSPRDSYSPLMVTTYSFKNKTVDCYVFENNGWCDSYLIEAHFSDNVRLTDAECAEFFAEYREEILEAELVS